MKKRGKRASNAQQASNIGICFEALEPRLLLSGSWGAVIDGPGPEFQADCLIDLTQGSVLSYADAGITGVESEHRSLTPENGRVDLVSQAPVLNPFGNAVPAPDASSSSIPVAMVIDITTATSLADNKDSSPNPEPHAGTLDAAIRRELVFVNDNVDAYEILINGIRESDTNRNIEIVVLDADRDGIQQVSDILAERTDLPAVHVIAHGSDGQISLGGSWLNSTTLQQKSDAVAGWGSALAETGDILFYGCNIAETENGQNLTEVLAELTRADVAASTDLTGYALFGGDWELEYQTGHIEASVAASQRSQDEWLGLMAVAVDNTSTGVGTGTNNVTFSHTTTTATGDRLMLVGVSMDANGGETVNSVTYGAQSLTLVGSRVGGSAPVRIEIWQLINPNAGTANVVVNLSGNADGVSVGATTFTGVDQTTPLGTFVSAIGTSNAPTVNVSSAAGELVYDVVAGKDSGHADAGCGSDGVVGR